MTHAVCLYTRQRVPCDGTTGAGWYLQALSVLSRRAGDFPGVGAVPSGSSELIHEVGMYIRASAQPGTAAYDVRILLGRPMGGVV